MSSFFRKVVKFAVKYLANVIRNTSDEVLIYLRKFVKFFRTSFLNNSFYDYFCSFQVFMRVLTSILEVVTVFPRLRTLRQFPLCSSIKQ